jgi:transmembrane sensor
MEMQKKEIEILLDKYISNTATEAERALVESWYLFHQPYTGEIDFNQLAADQKESLDQLLGKISSQKKRPAWPRIAVAASIIMLMAAGTYVLHKDKPVPQAAVVSTFKPDVTPGGNRAVLILSDGRTVVLNDAKTGKLASDGSTVINKTADGQISYANANASANANQPVYNTTATPAGGQYQLILSDGTKVWLNAASSIKYPVVFNNRERKVEITGEAYFEVAHDQKKPFRILSNGQTVEVLGTHFNINAYSNEEAVETTLLQGSIKVSAGTQSYMVRPGERARFKNGGFKIAHADVEAAVAWKNGFFHFNNDNLETVMRQLARWYAIQVKYEGKVPERQFSGEISRSANASQILDILKFKKVHFRIAGKTVIIMP